MSKLQLIYKALILFNIDNWIVSVLIYKYLHVSIIELNGVKNTPNTSMLLAKSAASVA